MASTPPASEIVNLLLILLIVPLSFAITRKLAHPALRSMVVGASAIAIGGILAVTEHLFLGQITRNVKDILYAVGGVSFAVAMIQINVGVRKGRI